MEQGEYKVGLDTLFKILQVFDLKMGEFFGETEPARRPRVARARRRLRRPFGGGPPRSARFRPVQEAQQQEEPARSATSSRSSAEGKLRERAPDGLTIDGSEARPAVNERRKHLEFLRKTAREAIWSGDYERALTLYDDGLGARPLLEGPRPRRSLHLQPRDHADRDGPAGLRPLAAQGDRAPQSVELQRCARRLRLGQRARGRAASSRARASTRSRRSRKSRDLGLEELTGNVAQPAREPRAAREPLRGGARPLRRGRSSALEAEGESALPPGRRRHRQPRLLPHRSRPTSTSGCRSSSARSRLLDDLGARQAMDYPSLDLCFANVKMRALRRGGGAGDGARSGSARSSAARTSSRTRTTCSPKRTPRWAARAEADEQYDALAATIPISPPSSTTCVRSA